ncbi:MAG: DUF4177 domain-containing protein [Alphaproteobacteria bacterium]|jgi:hypothetical protein|nr:DUF4177 domain-containing protein [Alphaproteobacteria bacterium]MCB1551117.1 DUF4177 domain-containing protein [Alphaproteobacteria bacterium]MCB9985022.1 DUF4177 domain-containing protein [Micavibrio sp.]HPQ51415.1 DUF4177 domain-containing protein [Alphaproteobacteria bacterium]HRK97412.1 DUF4177 domain-containing protein [Alphaproteobacteria bacterium]
MTTRYEYKTVIYKENLIGSLLLGESKVNPERMTEMLNEFGRKGWRVVTMERENRRSLLFFNREAFLIVMERVISA